VGPEAEMEEAEQRILPAPGRGIAVAAALTAAAGALIAVAFAAGWLSGHPSAAGHHVAAAPSPIQLLWRILLALTVIVVLAKGCGGAARLARQPEVLGEIVAGLILGPTLVRRLAPALFHAVLPAAVLPAVGVLAQAGLTIFMFMVGLEVDRDMLRRHGRVIAAASQAMMAVPFAAGLAVAIPLRATFAGHGIGLVPYALFIGTALSVTAFPVLARIVQESGLRETRLGSLAMLCASVCDVLAWCALIVVLAVLHAQGPLGVLRVLGLTAALCVAALLAAAVIRSGLRTLDRRPGGTRVPAPVLLLSILVLVVGLGAVTDKIGIHDIFGGFLAGLILPRDSELLRPVIGRLDALNRTLLLPVFFVSIGLQVNVWQAALRPAVLAGGALLLVVAIVTKFGGTALVAGAGGLPPRSALGLGALMNSRGVTDIVVISAGLSVGVINGNAFTVLILIALITTLMASPALRLLGLWRPADRSPRLAVKART
jgi:Kef-type K+ transport system membrane component KefB